METQVTETGWGLELRPHTLEPGEELWLEAAAVERVVVVLGGTCCANFQDRGPSWDSLGKRADVFDGPGTALFVPRGRSCLMAARAGGARLAVVAAAGQTEREPYVVRPEQVLIEQRGRGTWQREVHTLIGVEQGADHLVVGETFSRSGVWSGYPPHKHDRDDSPHESNLDERFLVRVRPPTGFGVLVHYEQGQEREHASVVRDGDLLSMSRGYHSFVAAGGHEFYYLWALAGRNRNLRARTDARHAWLLSEPR
ncbi:MAG TPA: 5-deoxy-glucuronate isomerase [Polyangiaceae bacterium]|nr:5-deoxy-glucuronate isomerase [Polyangiaceae bacterium]